MMPAFEKSNIKSLRAPAALRDLKQWLVWKFEPNPKAGKKDLKVPYYAKSGTKRGWMPGVRSKKLGQGSEEELPLLVTFEEAKAAAMQRGMTGVGIAMVKGCPITALDFDHCVSDGVIHPDVEALIVGTYAEISPSGTGVRAFVRGNLGDRSDAHPDDGSFGFETYSSSRFVTFTGDMTDDTLTFGCEDEVAEPSALLLETCEKRFGPQVIREISIGKSDKERVGLTDAQIKEVLQWTAAGDYKRWLAIGAAIHHETEGEGEWIWDEWSQGIADYEGPDEIRSKWSTLGNYSGDEKTFWSVLREAQALGCPIVVNVASIDDFEALPMPKGGKFNIRSQSEFTSSFRKIPWLVKNFLPKATLGVIYGESGSGKSFLVYDLCAAVSRGLETWCGKRVNQGRVLIVVAEGAQGFRQRIDAYCHQQGISPGDFDVDYISDFIPNLTEPNLVTDLIKEIKEREPYDLIVMDTFAQVMAGADENSGKDVGSALAQCKRINVKTGAMVLLVHHSGKDAGKGARGWSGLRAAADVELEITRKENDRAIKVTKLKDGQDGASMGFKLHTVVLGEDDDGDDITSCIVEFCEVSAKLKNDKGITGKNKRLAFDKAHDMIGLNPVGEVATQELIAAMLVEMPLDNGVRDQRKSIAARAITSLINEGLLEQRTPGAICLPKEADAQ
jgi:hypothetical protein